MTVREFTSGDDLVRSVGSLSNMTYGTFVLYVKLANITGTKVFAQLHTSGGSITSRLGVGIVDNDPFWGNGGSGPDFIDFADEDIWICYVFHKASGTVAPEASLYDSSTDTWFHETGDNTIANATNPGSGGTVRFTAGGSFSFIGRIAAMAVWSNFRPWTSTTEIENAGLEDAYQNWMDNNPSAAWRFNQSSIGDNVVDDTGNGADQTSITGTTVITGDDPPGFDFSLSSDIELDVPFHQNSVQIFNPTVQKQSPLEVNVPHFANVNQVYLATVQRESPLEVNVPFLDSMDQVFVPQVLNEGGDLFEPILAGNGSYADQIFEGLVSQGFLTGSLADRERARLLSKLTLTEPQGLSIQDLYSLANEENRLAGVLVGI